MSVFAGKSFKDIDGKVVQLDQVAKKVTLVVNVACFCGLTRHYPGLQELQVPLYVTIIQCSANVLPHSPSHLNRLAPGFA